MASICFRTQAPTRFLFMVVAECPSLPFSVRSRRVSVQGTDSMSRNHINVLTSSVVVALPGGKGTLSEVQLAKTYGKPVVLHGPVDKFTAFPADVPRCEALEDLQEFIAKELSG